jgi:hypothetical protein
MQYDTLQLTHGRRHLHANLISHGRKSRMWRPARLVLTLGTINLAVSGGRCRTTTPRAFRSGHDRGVLGAAVKNPRAKMCLGNSLWERIQTRRTTLTRPGTVLATDGSHSGDSAKGKEDKGCECAEGLHCFQKGPREMFCSECLLYKSHPAIQRH